ncbi:DUF2878 domain-containing protein [Cellvibrio polysaccharolyticus]|uniref:DUF2878 domain-containing protein n=1 Tax=Cellvibrio polysaccharolyticus TaxID=2082724 RepID=A0A928V714_9GAMM|nr:DUF2878 domain-containing protein [Cellvibrio polysaccharolyticus]MBE8717842.1 DUF2878 domain-containing protein [Cellvibrio polysaccharolyticus]
MNTRGRLVLNAGLFQIGWLACVFGAQQGWLLLIAIACLAAHVRWVAEDRNEWRSLVQVAVCGWILDCVLGYVGVFDFGDNHLLLPLWLALLWLLFASTLRYSLRWTAQPWWMGSVLGACGGALSYFGGAKLAGVGLPLGLWPSLLLIAAIWALLFPLLHRVARSSIRFSDKGC